MLFFLRALQIQKQRLQSKIEREQILMAKLPELSVRILELATEHGRLTVSQIVELTHANRNTVKKHVQQLVKKGRIVRHGKGRGAYYSPY